MILLDNIVFELQKACGVSLLWSEILKACTRRNDLSYKVIDSVNASKNIFYPSESKQIEYLFERLPLFLRRYNDVSFCDVDVFHSSYFRIHSNSKVKNIVTVHDFVYEKFDKGIRKQIHKFQKLRSLKRADVIISVSENTKDDMLYFYPELASKDIRVIHNGISEDFKNLAISDSFFYNVQPPYILFVGGRYSHKNFVAALKMLNFNAAKNIDLKLKVVGGSFNNYELRLMHELGVSQLVEYVGSVDNESLNKLYNEAFAFIYPSFYEGFGIPPLEAMASGCPVICSNLSSIPEVVGSAGLLFDPYNIDSSEEYFDLLLDKSFRQRVVNQGLLHSKNYSWKRTSEQTVEIYKELENW